MESKSLLDPPKIDFKPLSNSQEYNLSLNQEKWVEFQDFGKNFRRGTIKTGFQRHWRI